MGEKTSEGKMVSATSTEKGGEKSCWCRLMPRNYLSHSWKIVFLISGMIICCSLGFVVRRDFMGTRRRGGTKMAKIVKVLANKKHAPENGACYYYSTEYSSKSMPVSLNVTNNWSFEPSVYMFTEVADTVPYLFVCHLPPESESDFCFHLK